jgi:Putative transposase
LKRLEVRLVKAVWRWQRIEARRHGVKGKLVGGGVCFVQWFGSSLQLTPHLHLLVPEAVWETDGSVVPVGAPGDEDVAGVLARVLRCAKKDWEELEGGWPEDGYEELQQQAIQERLGLGEKPETGQRRRRVAMQQGFSLHADTAVHANDREGLERLARYGARGPVAECRLKRLPDGGYEYTPKKGTAFALTAAALVRRLVALLPPARVHLTSFHGAYAPNSRLRSTVTKPVPTAPLGPPKTTAGGKKAKKERPRLDWAQLHQRTFGTDVLKCPCGGRRSIRACYATRKQAEARLIELGVPLPSRVMPPARAPPQHQLSL